MMPSGLHSNGARHEKPRQGSTIPGFSMLRFLRRAWLSYSLSATSAQTAEAPSMKPTRNLSPWLHTPLCHHEPGSPAATPDPHPHLPPTPPDMSASVQTWPGPEGQATFVLGALRAGESFALSGPMVHSRAGGLRCSKASWAGGFMAAAPLGRPNHPETAASHGKSIKSLTTLWRARGFRPVSVTRSTRRPMSCSRECLRPR
jgi:hypothetical protein